MMMRLLLFLVCSFIFVPLSADVYQGRVIDATDREAVPGVTVVARDTLNKIVSFTSTDPEGSFSLTVKPQARTIEFSMVGYEKQSFLLAAFDTCATIALAQATEQLKNVNVAASQIKEQGDTITYYVATFAKEQDKSIGDVLRRMPGLNVDESGRIQYQGTDINRFYIEGQDMLGGRYGVATNGIAAADIGAVEVMENHQPMQVLNGISFSDQAALNLKLKDGAKYTWLANGNAGVGFSLQPFHGLWDGQLFTMSVMPKFQTLITFKTNNIGLDLSSEADDFTMSQRNTGLKNYYTIGHPSVGPLGNTRERFNVSHLLSVNQLWDVSETYKLKLQVDYLNNSDSALSATETTYFLKGGDVSVTENQRGHSRRNELNASIGITANERDFYLDNTMKINLNWDSSNYITEGTEPNTQRLSQSDFYVSNSFSLIRRLRNKRLIRLESLTEWESSPQALTVERDVHFAQHLRNHAFYNEEKSSYCLRSGSWGFTAEGGIKLYFSNLTARMDGTAFDSGNFATRRSYAAVYINPQLEKYIGKVELRLGVPVNFTYYSLGSFIGRKETALLNPTLSARFQAHHNLSLSLSGSIINSAPTLDAFYPGMIASDYRIFNEGLYFFKLSTRSRVSGSVRYRNTAHGFFASATAMHSWTSTPNTRSQRIEGENVLYGYVENNSTGRMLMVSWDVSKSVKAVHGGVALDGLFTRNRLEVLSQGSLQRTATDLLSLSARAYTSPCRMFYAQYRFKFNYSALHHALSSRTASMVHCGQLTLYPAAVLYVDFLADFYRNDVFSDSKNVAMLDAKITYKLSKKMEIRVSVTNIMNKTAYTNTFYGLLNTSTTSTRIRGRELMLSIYINK